MKITLPMKSGRIGSQTSLTFENSECQCGLCPKDKRSSEIYRHWPKVKDGPLWAIRPRGQIQSNITTPKQRRCSRPDISALRPFRRRTPKSRGSSWSHPILSHTRESCPRGPGETRRSEQHVAKHVMVPMLTRATRAAVDHSTTAHQID